MTIERTSEANGVIGRTKKRNISSIQTEEKPVAAIKLVRLSH